MSRRLAIGDKVEMTPSARKDQHRRTITMGVIVGFRRNCLGKTLLRIRRDGLRTIDTWVPEAWQPREE